MTRREYAAGRPLSTQDFYETIRLTDGRQERPDVVIWLEVAPSPWGRLETTPAQKWTAVYDGRTIVKRHRDPGHAACRVLFASGVTGKALFVHRGNPMPGLLMDIEQAAKFTVVEGDGGRGLRRATYVPFGTGIAPAADLVGEVL